MRNPKQKPISAPPTAVPGVVRRRSHYRPLNIVAGDVIIGSRDRVSYRLVAAELVDCSLADLPHGTLVRFQPGAAGMTPIARHVMVDRFQ